MKELQDKFEILVENLQEIFPKYIRIIDRHFFIVFSVKYYLNSDASYITAEINKDTYIYNFYGENKQMFVNENKDNYDERVQLIFYEGLTEIYNTVSKKVNKKSTNKEKEITRLFEVFIKRRKLKNLNECISLKKPNKIYI